MHSFDYNKPYHPLSQRYRLLFNQRVFKISVSVAQTCPNRLGFKGMNVCIFCDEWGSAAYHSDAGKSLKEQIALHRDAIRKQYNADKFLIYFQSYTNTFGRVSELAEMYHSVLEEEDVIGIVVGTRPDCLPQSILKVFEEISKTHFVAVELGVQTLDNEQLQFLSRGHDKASSIKAIQKLKENSKIDICIHLMFGLPGETNKQLRDTAHLLSELGVHGVKLHNLHVLKDTPLEDLYRQGKFIPVELEEYCRKVTLFLEHLSPEIAVHRLTAVASRWDELIAPSWTKEKMRPTQFIEDYLRVQNIWQGKSASNETFCFD
ncbi:MAG: TIGR01212 family radical SAM protein [SAR324 cluster bacterium]|nr:TIGR01212 family radical SAM protein [SAR324 cluster bacterium]